MSSRAASRWSCTVRAWALVAALLGCTDVGEVGASRAGGAAGSNDDGTAGSAGSSDGGVAGSTADAGEDDQELDEADCEEECACSNVVACPDEWMCIAGFCAECDASRGCDADEVCEDARCVDP